jgi:hypothetical protein
MGKSITTASSAVILTAAHYATYNPLSIATTGGITNSAGSAIYSNAAESWTINNAGTIASTGIGATSGGIFLKTGGTVTNVARGLISGVAYGVYIAGSGAGVTNSGTIAGTGAAGFGVSLPNGGTLTNAGTITGSGGTAVSLGAASRVIFDGGAVFNGIVAANTSVTNTLELAAVGTGGTVADLAGLFPGFNNIQVDAGAKWHWETSYTPPAGLNDTLTAGMSLTNAGTLPGRFYTETGGAITNMAGGKISLDTHGANLLMRGGTLINRPEVTPEFGGSRKAH